MAKCGNVDLREVELQIAASRSAEDNADLVLRLRLCINGFHIRIFTLCHGNYLLLYLLTFLTVILITEPTSGRFNLKKTESVT